MIFSENHNLKDPKDVGKYTGEFKHDRREGQGIMIYEGDSKFEGIWK